MPDKFAVLQKKYLSSFPKKLERIEGAWKKQDLELINDLIHKLAGSSGSYGFGEISNHCKNILSHLHKSKNNTNKDIDKSIKHLLSLLSNTQ